MDSPVRQARVEGTRREGIAGVGRLVKTLDPKDADYEHQQLEALWAYQTLDKVEPKLLATLLQAKDHHARAAAVRVLSHWHDRLPNPLELLAVRIADDHPQVRLEAVRALGQIPTARSAEIALRALERPVDRWLDYALWLTLRDLTPHWLPALEKGEFAAGDNPRTLLFALQSVGSREALKPLVALLQAGKVTPEREEGVLGLLAALGGPAELSLIFDRALATEGNTTRRQGNLLQLLDQAARQRRREAGWRSDSIGRVGDRQG